MPNCPIHGFYFGYACPACSTTISNKVATPPPRALGQGEGAETPPGQLNTFFQGLLDAARNMSEPHVRAVVVSLIDSNKNIGFGNPYQLKGLNQRYTEFSDFSQPDQGHVHWYNQQVDALKHILGMCTDRGIKFSAEDWRVFDFVMNRPPPTCKAPPNFGWRDPSDDGSGGYGSSSVRTGQRRRIQF